MRNIAKVGWIFLAAWFAVFEFFSWKFEDWTLTNQWHEWMLMLPPWAAWVLFGVFVFIGLHLWWPVLTGRGRDGH